MRFLADESCDFAVVRALRGAGYDVRAVAEGFSGAPDREVIAVAQEEVRIVLTEDKDFGRLAYAGPGATVGVCLLRFPAGRRAQMADSVVILVRERGDALAGSFCVLQPGRVRILKQRA